VDRTLESGQITGQLRGRRSIERWCKADRQPPNFAMNANQFRRFRQTGTYGAYRVVLRSIPGLTTGDGWTPAATALQLARWVNDSLGEAGIKQKQFESGTRWGYWGGGLEARYWVEHGWPTWQVKAESGFLPTPNEAISEWLPEAERLLLERTLFGDESVRRVTAYTLARAKGAKSHAGLCDALADSTALAKKLAPKSLAPLPAFTRFAEAAMHTMRGLWSEIHHDGVEQAPAIHTLARLPELQERLELARKAAVAWLNAPGRNVFPHDYVITRLAEAMQAAKTPSDQLRALAQHHQEHGGGLRWFREQAGKLVPLAADTGIAASDYGFRLFSLSRLAAQCGVADMNNVLQVLQRHEFEHEADDEEGDAP
jgi:hypothetical protein